MAGNMSVRVFDMSLMRRLLPLMSVGENKTAVWRQLVYFNTVTGN